MVVSRREIEFRKSRPGVTITETQARRLASQLRGIPAKELLNAGFSDANVNLILAFETQGARRLREERIRVKKSDRFLRERALNLREIANREKLIQKAERGERITIADYRQAGLSQKEIANIGKETFKLRAEAIQRFKDLEKERKKAETLVSRKKTFDETLGTRLKNKVSTPKRAQEQKIKEIQAKATKQKIEQFLRASIVDLNREISSKKDLDKLRLDIKNLEKAIAKQSTPERQARITLAKAKEREKFLNKTQKVTLEQVVKARDPVKAREYIKNVKKYEKGFSKKDFEAFDKTLLKFGKDVLKGGGDAVQLYASTLILNPYQYGRNLVKRGLWSNNLSRNPVLVDVIKLGTSTVKIAKFVAKNPQLALLLVGAGAVNMQQSLEADFKKNPTRTFSRLIAEWYGPQAILKGGKLAIQLISKLRPSYASFNNGKLTLRKEPEEKFKVRGKTRFLQERVKKASLKRPLGSAIDFLKGRKAGQFKRFTKDPGLILKEQTVKSGASPLSKQALLEGQEITAVNASAEQLTSFIKRKQIVRKPIPGESSFPATVRKILLKFDNGIKLSKREFAFINKWLQKNVAPNITLLERSLYADPKSGFRTSRLGITKERTATLRDILKGRATFKSAQPQVLIFENAKVARFPKYLADIKKKLLADKKLTTTETNRLIAFQIKTGSGKFKPIGSTIYKGGVELEVTLAPGELIKRIKQVGFTYIQGKKVTFVTAEVWKPPKTITSKLKKAQEGKLTPSQVTALEKSLSKKLGRSIRVETPDIRTRVRSGENKPVIRVTSKGLRALRAIPRQVKRVKGTRPSRVKTTRKIKRVTTRAKPKPSPRVKARPTPRPKPRPTPRPSPRARARVVARPRPKPTPRPVRGGSTTPPPGGGGVPKIRFNTKGLQKKGSRQGYIIKIKKGNKIIRQTEIPLPRIRAENLGRRIIDNSPRASFSLVPKGKTDIVDVKVKKLQSKFRLKRSKGTKVLKYVEKRKFRIDRKGEKKGLKKVKRGKKK